MMSQETRKRAAVAAVIALIRQEEESMAAVVPAVPMTPAAAPLRLWGVSGRQDQMAQRRMMQSRTRQR